MSAESYLRHPHVRGDQVVFVAENDVWLAGTSGGRAYRVSADQVPVVSPRLSPDGHLVAWSARRDGAHEVYVADVDGGGYRRLTHWGQDRTWVRGWVSDTEVLVVSTTGEAERSRMWAHAVPVDGSPARRLDWGWAADLATGPSPVRGRSGVLLSTTTTVEPAWWKRYRGGTAAQLWLDRDGSGEFERILADLPSSLVSPLWATGADGTPRLGFVSDHDDRGQVYSLRLGRRAPRVADLVRHTSGELYARHASSDGRQVVYVAGGELWLLASLDEGVEPRRVEVRLAGASPAQQPTTPKPQSNLGTISPDRTGRASAIETRGTVQWVTHRDGPVRALAAGSGVRRSLPVVLGETGRVAWVTDADGDDAIELATVDDTGATPVRIVGPGRLGTVLELAASPDGQRLAAASHDGRLFVIDVPKTSGRGAKPALVTPKEIARSTDGDVSGLAFSPDSAWLAWSAPGKEPLRQIRLARLGARTRVVDVTPLRFADTEPVFTVDGKHLAFLSVRSFDPVYDAFVFDLSFPNGCRPHLVPLAAHTPSPFDPWVSGHPVEEKKTDKPEAKKPVPVKVDLDGLDQRVVAVPVEGSQYSDLRAVQGGLVWRRHPLVGELGADLAHAEDDPARPTVERIDFATGKVEVLAEAADDLVATPDGLRIVVVDQGAVKVLPSAHKVEADSAEVVEVDLSRIRLRVEPRAEWAQMYDEAWRLMRDHYWRADMNGVDWVAARERYRPMLARLGSHDDLVDLIWEMQGELGSSHAYCTPRPDPTDPVRRQGLLGADLRFARGRWVVDRVIPGEPSDRLARSPLSAPGVGVRAGEVVLAVDGVPTSRTVSPASLLVGTANRPVELTVAARGGSPRRVVVVPLADEMPLRYQDWVNDRRRYVHAQTGGAVGYLHVPDMVSGGWAQLHRDLRTELAREGLVVDVRGNRGGHTSQLVIEKLARRIIGWNVVRSAGPGSYPDDARRGPMVAVTDMHAGSDGDIVTAAIRSLGLGPVVGTRTWGGVIGIDGRYSLIDGTSVTQPRYAFWFERFGWGVENYGVDPDVEVPVTPQQRAAGEDPQLDRALGMVTDALAATPALTPPPLPPLS